MVHITIDALVMERKMYESFLSTFTHERQNALKVLLVDVPQDRSTQEQFLEMSPIFQEHMVDYEVYCKKVMDGDHNTGACISTC